jgi:DNA-binding transcriptional regulator YhcF (GntR family)
MIRIDLDSPQPLEDQIVLGLRQAVAQGMIEPGAALPSVRQLAGDLGVHWNTVARAYRRLAEEGVLIVRRGRGAILNGDRRTVPRTTKTALRGRLTEAIAGALVGGLSRDEITAIFTEALSRFEERKGR